jgi:hypothetical protein
MRIAGACRNQFHEATPYALTCDPADSKLFTHSRRRYGVREILQETSAMSFRPTLLCSALLTAGLAFLAGCGGQHIQPMHVFVTQTSLPNVVAGNSYSATLTATNGTAPYTFTLSSGTLPAGLTFTAGTNDATITGTATTVGSYTFVITVTDANGGTNFATYTVGVSGLSGQYFFYEQYYYDVYDNQKVVKRDSSSSRHGWPSAAMLQQAILHPEHRSAPGLSAQLSRIKGMHAHPAQGSFNSSIAWGSVAGSVTLDGSGNVTGGEYNANGSYGSTSGAVTGGKYSLGTASAGTLSLELDGNAGPQYYVGAHNLNATSFANQTASLAEATTDNATYIEYGDGQLMLQTNSALATPLSANWVFGLRGETCYECDQSSQGDLLTAGLFNFDGAGNVTSTSQADITTGFDTDSGVPLAGTIVTAPDTYGRTTAALSTNTYDNGALPVNYVIYTIDATHAYVISTDQIGQNLPPYLYGPLDQQAGIDFAGSTVTGNYVAWGSSEDLVNEVAPDTASDTQISLLTADGDGNVTGSGDYNDAGQVSSGSFTGTYTVSAAGRVEVDYGSTPSVTHAHSYVGHAPKSHKQVQQDGASQVFWLVDGTQGFGLQQTYGDNEPAQLFVGQQSGTFSNSSLSGSVGLGSEYTATSASIVLAGTATSDGNGNLTGVVGVASQDGAATGALTATYTVAANGRGTAVGSSQSILRAATFYVVNSGQIVAMDTSGDNIAPGIIDILK